MTPWRNLLQIDPGPDDYNRARYFGPDRWKFYRCRTEGNKRIGGSSGEAWKDIGLSIFALPPVMDVFTMPAVSEPFIAWTTSGDIEMQERENNGP